MDEEKLWEILRREYGINNEEEFDAAVDRSPGINLGIFTMPLAGRSEVRE